jgi:tRNA G10  N-methylase Trm11
MVEYTKENLTWLVKKNPKIEVQASVEVGDATSATWPRFSLVASELYLGRPLNSLPERAKLDEIIQGVNSITRKFLKNLSSQLKSGQRACLAVPAWKKPDGKFTLLPVLDKLTEMGYNYLDLKYVPKTDLLYYREDQVVARQLIRLEKM